MKTATKTYSRTHLSRPRTSRSLRSAAHLGLGLLSLLSLSAGTVAHAGTVNWDNTPGDWFANPSHWVGGSYPGAGDDAVNMSTAAMTLGQSTTISSFFSNGAFSLQGGTFSGSQAGAGSTITVNNVFTDNGGGISNFTVQPGTGGSVVFGNSGGNFIDSDIFNAAVSFANDSYTRLYNTNTFNGAINFSGTSNGIQLQDNNANLVNNGSLNGYGSIFQVYGGATVTNNGTMNANSAGNALSINTTNFNNAGTAEATATGSVLTLNSNGTNTGTFAASGGGAVDIHGAVTSGVNSAYNAAGGMILIDGGSLTGTVGSTTGTGLTFSNNGNNSISGATINGTLTFSALDAYTRLYGVVTENGAINIGTTANGIQLQDSNTNLVLGSAGSLNGYGNIFQVYGGTTVTNNGLVNANSSGNALTMNTSNFVNSGTAEATGGGILNLSNNTTNNGTIAAKSGGIVNITGGLTSNAGSLMDGASGTFNITDANLVGTITGTAGTTLNFNNSGGNSINNGAPATTLNVDTSFANDAYTRVYGTVTDNNVINFASTSNGIQLQDNNTNLVNNGSLNGYGNIFQVYGGATLTNNGTVNANSPGNVLSFTQDNTVNNSGATLEATGGGVLDLNNNTTNSGTIRAGAGSTVNIANNFVSSAGSLMDGVGGTFNLQNVGVTGIVTGTAGTVLNFGNSGNNSISGATLNADTSFANDAYTRVYGTVTDNNVINFASTSNGIQLQDSNTNLINNGSLNGYGNIFQVYGGTTVTNNGLVNASSSGNALTMNTSNFANNGTAEATGGGVLDLSNNTTNSGTIAAKSGGIANVSGNFVSSIGSLMDGASGTFNLQNVGVTGIVTGTAGTALNFGNSGNNSISGATLNVDTSFANDAYTRVYGTVTDNNVINFASTSNGIQLQDNNANLVLGSAGSLNGYGTVFQVYGGTTLTNNGTINANVSGQALNINTSNFANTGTVQVGNGAALSVTSANTDNGNILVQTGGTATFTQGLTQTAGLTQVDGTLNSPLTLTGGTLAGTGTVNGNVTNTGGTVSAGNSASPFGTLAVSGTFSQTSGTLGAVFSSAQNSLLAVSGAVLTGGALNVSYLGAGPYTGSGPFTFLDYGSLTSSLTGTTPGQTQYFSNETFQNGEGIVDGSNGFVYELLNDANADGTGGLQLEVLQNGAPTPAVPEASTTVSMGLLLLLGSGLVLVKRRRAASSLA